MAKKQKTTDTLNLESILFNCREYLRSNASLNDKRDLLLTLVFLRFIGEKFENAQNDMRQECFKNGITDEQTISAFLNSPSRYKAAGILHLFIKHTSAGLTINENADPDVQTDMEAIFNRLVKEREPYYQHTCEGDDDMPAHAKATLSGTSLTIPITNGRLNIGIWQGIYLCEFRNRGGGRRIVATVIG